MCTCTEDKYVVINGQEVLLVNDQFRDYPGIIIGRNKVRCQECIDVQIQQDKNRQKQMLLSEIKDLEQRIYYSQLDGATEFVESKMAQRQILKDELEKLG